LLLSFGVLPFGGWSARAEIAPCRAAISAAETAQAIPSQLLAAIGRVESGRADPLTGTISPWPWTVDVEGVGHYYPSKQEAIAAVLQARARGVQSIDVGCLQVNLLQHPDAFGSLDQAFDPVANADYGAKFLHQLRDQTGSWPQAAADYHSQTPALGAAYKQMVMRAWPDERKLAAAAGDAVDNSDLAGFNLASPIAALPFRISPGLIRMGAAAPPMGRPMVMAAAEPVGAAPVGVTRAGRDLSAYRRNPIQWTRRAGQS
jgi:hypothetical protein